MINLLIFIAIAFGVPFICFVEQKLEMDEKEKKNEISKQKRT